MTTQQQTIQFAPEYPARQPFFGFVVMKLAYKMCLATEIGGDAVNLLMLVAMTEDCARYRHPAWLWNKQARDYLGVCTDTLIAIRDRLVSSGWLHYRYRGRKRAPEYWVCIPEGVGDDERNDLGERLDQYARLRSVDFVDSSSIDRRSIVDRSSTDRRLNVDPFYSDPDPDLSTSNLSDGGGVSENLPRGHAALTEPETLCSGPQPNAEQLAELQQRLRGVGVDLTEATVLTALSVGHTVASIGEILAYAESRPGWWGGGAVRLRLTRQDAVPLPVDRGWAIPDATAKARWDDARRRATESARLDALSSRPAAVTPATQQSWDWAALEAAYGQQIDAAPIDELMPMLATDFARRLLSRAGGRQAVSVRRELLRAFADASG